MSHYVFCIPGDSALAEIGLAVNQRRVFVSVHDVCFGYWYSYRHAHTLPFAHYPTLSGQRLRSF